MPTPHVLRAVMLYKRKGSEDKVYQVELVDQGGSFLVRCKNARRGQQLRPAKEFANIATIEAAQKQYDACVKAKTKDGYTDSEDGTPYTSSEFAGANGENRMLMMDQQRNVVGVNKRGLIVDVPAHWVEQVQGVATDPFILCGEHVGDRLYVFDALMIGGQDLRSLSFVQRYTVLETTLAAWHVPAFEILTAYFDPAHKAQMLGSWQRANREGGVFKLKDQPHVDGYSDVCLKHKFVESSACQVLGLNGEKRSARIGLLDAHGQMVPVGNVTLPANAPAVAEGDVVEVQYLYYNPGGAFEQPVFLFKRGDMVPGECLLSQVTRLKPEAEAEEQGEPAARERMRA